MHTLSGINRFTYLDLNRLLDLHLSWRWYEIILIRNWLRLQGPNLQFCLKQNVLSEQNVSLPSPATLLPGEVVFLCIMFGHTRAEVVLGMRKKMEVRETPEVIYSMSGKGKKRQ